MQCLLIQGSEESSPLSRHSHRSSEAETEALRWGWTGERKGCETFNGARRRSGHESAHAICSPVNHIAIAIA